MPTLTTDSTSTKAAPALENDLVELLEELSSTQSELLQLLAAKRKCMVKSDLEGMQSLEERQVRLCERLELCQQRRSELLLSARGQGVAAETLSQLALRLEGSPNASLGKQTRQAASRMRLLQHESLTNWVLAQRTLLHLSQLVEIVATGGQLQPTYGKQGSGARGALVDRAA